MVPFFIKLYYFRMRTFALITFARTACLVVACGVQLVVSSQIKPVAVTETKDEFVSGTKWMNTDFPLNFSSFRDKVLLIHTMDLGCAECIEENIYLSKEVESMFHIQMVTVFAADSSDVFHQDRIKKYIESNRINHPVAVVPDYNGLQNLPADRKAGVLMAYLNQHKPFQVLSKSGISAELTGLMDSFALMAKSPNAGTSFSKTRYMPTVNQEYLSQPLIENPTYMCYGAGAQQLFVTDAAHNRILLLDPMGSVNTVIGSAGMGFADGSIDVAKFHGLSGLCYDEKNYLLYIADMLNHRLRVADFKNGEVRTVLGNGISFRSSQLQDIGAFPGITEKILDETEALGFPVDVLLWSDKVLVASAEYNQIFECNPTAKSASEWCRIDVPVDPKSGTRPMITNMSMGTNEVFCVLSDGSVYRIAVPAPGQKAQAVLFFKKDGIQSLVQEGDDYYGCVNHSIVKYSSGEFKTYSGSNAMGFKNGKGSKSKFAFPFDIIKWHDQWMVTDASNNVFRLLSGKKGKSKTFRYLPSSNLWRFADATSHCESAAFEAIATGTNPTVTVNLDLGEYVLEAAGQNEVHSDGSAPLSFGSMDISGDEFTFSVKEEEYSGVIFMELFLTLRNEKSPDVYYFKRAFLNVQLEFQESSPSTHSVNFKPIIR